MCDRTVIGCQLAATGLRKAQLTPLQVKPLCTCAFPVTKALSSKLRNWWRIEGRNTQATTTKSRIEMASAFPPRRECSPDTGRVGALPGEGEASAQLSAPLSTLRFDWCSAMPG